MVTVRNAYTQDLSNPNTSEESKQRSEQILEELGQGPAETQSVAHQTRTGDTKDEGNVLRGHKVSGFIWEYWLRLTSLGGHEQSQRFRGGTRSFTPVRRGTRVVRFW